MKDQSVGKKITINNFKTDWPMRLAEHVRSSNTNLPTHFRSPARTPTSCAKVQTVRALQQSTVPSKQYKMMHSVERSAAPLEALPTATTRSASVAAADAAADAVARQPPPPSSPPLSPPPSPLSSQPLYPHRHWNPDCCPTTNAAVTTAESAAVTAATDAIATAISAAKPPPP